MSSRCLEQGIDYFRLSPHLHMEDIPATGETDRDKLVEMVVESRKCLETREALDKLSAKFACYSSANQKMCKRINKKYQYIINDI